MNKRLSICVFCGARSGANPDYAEAARAVGQLLGEQGHRLVYGGGAGGLMGVVADSALAAGGQVMGIIPQALVHLEHAHQGLSELVVVDTMHQRKALMAEYSDAYLSLAGGIGTLEEMAEMWTLNVLGYQNKPMALLNTAGYYDDYLKYLARMQAEGFASAAHLARLRVGQEPAAVLVDLLADLLAQV
ncbi:MAG: TIGR00730 family Rossman fold protein [Brachymonas sp.]